MTKSKKYQPTRDRLIEIDNICDDLEKCAMIKCRDCKTSKEFEELAGIGLNKIEGELIENKFRGNSNEK